MDDKEWEFVKTADASDFLGLTPQPGFKPPSLRNRNPMINQIPDADTLFAIQNNLLRTLQALRELEQDNPDIHWTGIQHHLTQSYKSLRNWLEENA